MKHPLHVLTLMLAMAIAPAWAAPGSLTSAGKCV